jgi:solute:Na+ symporter, SSS family
MTGLAMNTFSLEISTSTKITILSIVSTYLILITIFGSYFSKYNKNINDFFFSGQRFTWWLPAMSMVATGVGAYSFLKYTEQGFATGMSSTITYINDWFVIPFFLFGWLPILYFSRIKSIPEYFERRFNTTTRRITVFILLFYMLFYIGYNFFTAGIAIEALFGIPQIFSVSLIAILLAFYVTLGGQTAVIFTDLIQGLMLILGGVVAIYCGINALGGFSEFWSHLPQAHKLPFVDLNKNEQFNTIGVFWGEALAGSIAFAFMNQGFIMRYLTIKSVNEGKKAAFFNLLITMPFCAVIVGAMGWIAKAIIEKQSFLQGPISGFETLEITNTFHTFILVCWYAVQSNALIFGFIIAGLLSALMSTIDTLVNACAAIFIYDIYKPFTKDQKSDEHYLKMAKYASFFTTLIGVLFVILFNIQTDGQLSLMSLHYKGIMVIIPSLVMTLFMGLIFEKFHSKAANISLLAGSTLTFLTLIYPNWIDPLALFLNLSENGNYIFLRAVFGMTVTLTLGFLCTYLWKEDQKNIQGLTFYSILSAKQSYKKSNFINETPGKILTNLKFKIDNSQTLGTVSIPANHMKDLKAQSGDLIYISDNRWYLGGLRAGHLYGYENQDTDIKLSEETLKSCYLDPKKPVYLEKIF